MRWRVFTIIAALSRPLCIGTAGVWGYCVCSGKALRIWEPSEELYTWSNHVAFGPDGLWMQYVVRLQGVIVPGDAIPRPVLRQWGGFSVGTSYSASIPEPDGSVYLGHHFYRVGVPYWAILLTGLILPALWFRSWRHARVQRWRIAHGCCTACGYDLRASKERCPECATPLPTQSQGVQR